MQRAVEEIFRRLRYGHAVRSDGNQVNIQLDLPHVLHRRAEGGDVVLEIREGFGNLRRIFDEGFQLHRQRLRDGNAVGFLSGDGNGLIDELIEQAAFLRHRFDDLRIHLLQVVIAVAVGVHACQHQHTAVHLVQAVDAFLHVGENLPHVAQRRFQTKRVMPSGKVEAVGRAGIIRQCVHFPCRGVGEGDVLHTGEGNFAVNPKMALFIPLIGGTGGNVGIQSSAIVVQGLANNSLKEGNILPQILKESVVSLINASIISLVVFIYNFFMLGDRGITASVSLSLFAVVMFASIFGTLVPMTLDKLKIDPALATGPFITITNDIIGMMIYMFITSALAG